MTEYNLTLWQANGLEILPATAASVDEIAPHAKQLSVRDRKQIIQGFNAGNYEMVINFVWSKAMAALKKELGTLGIKFLGEMIGKPDLTEDDDVVDSVTDREAVRLAEELGVVSSTEAMRLRQAHELVVHFSSIDASEIDTEGIEMDIHEATSALKTCVKNILGKPKIEVAKKFVDFRDALESETFTPNDERIKMLTSSPYFFRKLTISILLSVIKKNVGAKLEHALSNINLLIPHLWDGLRDTEKWQVGHTYAEVHSAGQTTAVKWLQNALLKVKGFDFVPENLRSDTFVKAAENILKAHEDFNNFINEETPMRVLTKLGSTIPMPALSICASAILAVRLGNYYGASFTASPLADKMLKGFTHERWQYYLNQCLPGDVRILRKLEDSKPIDNWFEIIEKNNIAEVNIKNKTVKSLIKASEEKNKNTVKNYSRLLLEAYYGKQ